MSTPSSDQLTVIFDGTCGFCTAIRQHTEPRDPHRRLSWVPCQALPTEMADRARCETTVITITPGGIVDFGAQAAARILTTLTGSPWPVRVASLPLFCSLLGFVYHLTSLVRHRLPGVTPWCERHPEECRPPAETDR